MVNFVIGITGGSGSGKSYISNILNSKFSQIGLSTTVFDQDQYYKDRDKIPTDKNECKNFDLPHSLYLEKYKSDFFKLLNGEEACQRKYNYNYSDKNQEKIVRYMPRNVIIAEGIFSIYDDTVFQRCDLTIFVDADLKVKMQRRIKRDKEQRDYDEEDVLYKFENHIIPSYRKYIEPLKSKCDIVLDNSNENEFLSDEIESIFRKVKNASFNN